VLERSHDRLLPDHLVEGLGSVRAIERGHRFDNKLFGMAVEERAPARAALTLEQFLALRRPTEVVASPDGRSVAFSVSAGCAEKGARPESSIWAADLEGTCTQLTRGGGVD